MDVDVDSEDEDEDEHEMDRFQSPIPFMGDAFGSPSSYANDNLSQKPEANMDGQADDKNDLEVEHWQQLFDLEQDNAWEPEHCPDEIGAAEMEVVMHVPVDDNESEDFDTMEGWRVLIFAKICDFWG